METVILGRTGLKVSAAGLGCGGFSRAGLAKGADHAAGIVREAYNSGVSFFDTAAAYGTQSAVGKGLEQTDRNSYVLSTKFSYKKAGEFITAGGMRDSLEQSLRELKTDCIDVFHIHALTAQDYDFAKLTYIPELYRAREQGKIRFLGVTEHFGGDTSHEMLKKAIPDDLFDVIMVGYNILNPSAANTILPAAAENNLGVLCMFAVRKALWDRQQLKADIERIISAGQGGQGLNEHSLDFLVEQGVSGTLPEAAYRFCRHTPGISVTLTGTGSLIHLKENLKSLDMPPLCESALEKLSFLFWNSDCVSGQ